MDLLTALRQGLIDTRTGEFKNPKEKSGRAISLSQALSQKHVTLPSSNEDGMALSDALRQGLVDKNSGRLVDRFSGKNIRISEAIKRGLLNPHISEVFDSKTHLRITLEEALEKEIIDELRGHYVMDKVKRLNYLDAFKKNYLCSPMTLKMCDDFGLIDSNGTIRDPVLDQPVTILQGVLSGFLDINLKSIKDVKSDQYVTLGEALQNAIITPSGEFCDTKTRTSLSLTDAVKKGYLTTVSKKSIFDIEGIKDSSSGEYISFNVALTNGSIDKRTGQVLEHMTNRKLSFDEACKKNIIQQQLAEMLKRKIGMKDKANPSAELTLVQAVFADRIDPNSGLIIDSNSGNTVPLEVAINNDLISPMGAAVLKSLLSITVTTATVTQTVRRSFKVSSNDSQGESAILFQDALKKGLINEKNMIFTNPKTNQTMPLEEAINLGLVQLNPSSTSSKVIRSSFSSGGGIGDSRSSLISEERRGSYTTSTERRGSTYTSSTERRGSTYTSTERKSISSQQEVSPRRLDSMPKEIVDATKNLSNTRYIPITIVQDGNKPVVPNNGYSLKEAIALNYFDISKCVFIKSNRRISSAKDIIKQKLIDYKSVKVSSPEGKIDLKKALDKKIIDDNWRYKDGKKYIPLKQAIQEGKVAHSDRMSRSTDDEDIMVITPNVKFRKSSGKFEVGSKLTPSDLTNALREGKIRPTDVRVKVPSRTPNEFHTINFSEAIQSGVIDKSTGDYKIGGDKISIIEGITRGYISILGSPDVDAYRYG